jgi:hypothetical protein
MSEKKQRKLLTDAEQISAQVLALQEVRLQMRASEAPVAASKGRERQGEGSVHRPVCGDQRVHDARQDGRVRAAAAADRRHHRPDGAGGARDRDARGGRR